MLKKLYIKLEGNIVSFIKYDVLSGEAVFKLKTESGAIRVVKGFSTYLEEDSEILCLGKEAVCSSYGKVFQAEDIRVVRSNSETGLIKFLTSAIKGCGESKAKALVDAFGKTIFNVLEHNSAALTELKGFSKKTADTFHANYMSYLEEKRLNTQDRDALTFLMRHGFTKNKAAKLLEAYKENTVEVLKIDPYVMAGDLKGFGFLTADKFALSTGVMPDSGFRIKAGLVYVLQEALAEGSCGLSIAELSEKGASLMGVSDKVIKARLPELIEEGKVVGDMSQGTFCLFLPEVYTTETHLAQLIKTHIYPKERGDTARLIEEALQKIPFRPADVQIKAVEGALTNNLFIITGPPGSGKTTILKMLLSAYKSLGLRVLQATPTGKASVRMQESTGHKATTLHKMLEPQGAKFKRNMSNPLEADIVVVDEFSMSDIYMSKFLFEAIARGTSVVLVGDADQIPSVGPGKVLFDLIASEAVPYVKLDKVHRQEEGSGILQAALLVNAGKSPQYVKDKTSFCWQELDTPHEILAELLKSVRDSYKKGYHPLKDVQVITSLKKGLLGTANLNNELRKILNPFPETKVELPFKTFATGDKVIHMKNDRAKRLSNGEIGFITHIQEIPFLQITVEYPSPESPEGVREVTYTADDLSKLEPAFAITVHKSQGSESKMIVMPVSMSQFIMLKRNLIYTGITRAREYMHLIGESKALWLSIKNNQLEDRWSRLQDLLSGGLAYVEDHLPMVHQDTLF